MFSPCSHAHLLSYALTHTHTSYHIISYIYPKSSLLISYVSIHQYDTCVSYPLQGTEPYIVRTKAVVNRMMLYPFILAAVYTAPLIHRWATPETWDAWYVYLQRKLRCVCCDSKSKDLLQCLPIMFTPVLFVDWHPLILTAWHALHAIWHELPSMCEVKNALYCSDIALAVS